MICLSMIMKNEAPRLKRCLASVRPHIDRYVICDTGSTDDSVEVAKEALLGLRGEFRHDRWEDFSTNRNLALEGCQEDWVLTIDADEIFCGSTALGLDKSYDCYSVLQKDQSGLEYRRRRLLRNNGNWHYVGKTHEVIISKKPEAEVKECRLGGFWYEDFCDSSRRQAGKKFLEDVVLLEKQRLEEPKDTRTVFYLAQSYYGAGMPGAAVAAYRDRVAMAGWEEEVYYSLLQIARITNNDDAYLAAYANRPSRLEALAALCGKLNAEKRHTLAYLLAKDKWCDNQDILFVEAPAKWRLKEEFAVAAWHLGQKGEAKTILAGILSEERLTGAEKQRVERNLSLCG